ncbi:MAG: flagellar hook-length control protein FliK [Planctomycetota bacterium]|nr:MAG: flagellar hook-length control protein FliK [Planctomycetota bacterium]
MVTEQLADHLRLQIRRGARRARLQLRPAELGSVDVRLHMGREGLQAELRLERPEVAQAVRHSLGELRAALESARLPVGRIEVQLATPDGLVATGGGANPGGHQASMSSHTGGGGGHTGGSAAPHDSRLRSPASDSGAPERLETRAPGRLDLIA